jgi:hypothetical protein
MEKIVEELKLHIRTENNHGSRPVHNICHLPDPCHFSFPTTFNKGLSNCIHFSQIYFDVQSLLNKFVL